jgi:poly-gamma-glutamate capsule biosynthesis protein CapA/YwtB (metallophosphatase superfamily)
MRRRRVRQQVSEGAGAGGGATYARGVRNGGRLRVGLAAIVLATAVWGSLQLAAPAASGRSGASPSAHVTIAFAGDIALLGPAPSSIFAGVRAQLRRAGVAIGNLEGTLSSGGTSKCGKHSTGCFAFQSPPQSAALLRGAGFDDLNVANNHAFDYGASGQHQTLRALGLYKLRWSGRPGQITVLSTHGVSVAILGFAPYPWAQSLTNISAAQALVRRAAAHADLVVAVLHAGAEGTDHQHVPRGTEYYLGENRGNERAFSHALVAAGANLVLASGPHVLRALQLFHDTLIAYSLGNFATAGHALSTGGILGEGGILVVTLRADGKFVSGRLLPVRMVGGEPRRAYGMYDTVRRINSLSRADFGGSAVLVRNNDALGVG